MDWTNIQPRRTYAPMHETSSGGAKLRVVIVEDSPLIRARLSESLAEIPNVEIVEQVETESQARAGMRQTRCDAARSDTGDRMGRRGARPPAEGGHRPRSVEGARTGRAAGAHQDHRVHELRV